MAYLLLFCIADEAKSFTRSVLNKQYLLVESYVCPSSKDGFKTELKENETFETDFIGATEEECQKWVQEKQSQVNFIEGDLIVIADARSARDGTLLILYFDNPLDEKERDPATIDLDADEDREQYIWYSFRVDCKAAPGVITDLTYVEPDCVDPVYFSRKEELTDENGVFNAAKAERLMLGKKS